MFSAVPAPDYARSRNSVIPRARRGAGDDGGPHSRHLISSLFSAKYEKDGRGIQLGPACPWMWDSELLVYSDTVFLWRPYSLFGIQRKILQITHVRKHEPVQERHDAPL